MSMHTVANGWMSVAQWARMQSKPCLDPRSSGDSTAYTLFFARTDSQGVQPQMNSRRKQRTRHSGPQYWPTGTLQHGSQDMSDSALALSCEWHPLGLYEGVLEITEERKQGILSLVKSDIPISPRLSAHRARLSLAQDGRGSDRSAGCTCNKAGETERPGCHSNREYGPARATVSVWQEFPCSGVRGCQHLI